jgi:glucokinase
VQRVLAADVGGTNARFAIAERDGDGVRLVTQRTYESARFPSFEPALRTFLAEAGTAANVRNGVIAFAGPIDDQAGRLVNRSSWSVDRGMLGALGIQARLVNDFQALAEGVAHAVAADFLLLQHGRHVPGATIALVGAGTGLGVAFLMWDGQRYRALPSEAGHMSFAPHSGTELELLSHLSALHGRVSAERVVSGQGLTAILEFLRPGGPRLAAAEISSRALADRASAEAAALALFIRCYGGFAGDIALACLSRGGVYVCGGIAAKLAARFGEGDFMGAFLDKGRHRTLVGAMPVRLVTNEQLGLIGAARLALTESPTTE